MDLLKQLIFGSDPADLFLAFGITVAMLVGIPAFFISAAKLQERLLK